MNFIDDIKFVSNRVKIKENEGNEMSKDRKMRGEKSGTQ